MGQFSLIQLVYVYQKWVKFNFLNQDHMIT